MFLSLNAFPHGGGGGGCFKSGRAGVMDFALVVSPFGPAEAPERTPYPILPITGEGVTCRVRNGARMPCAGEKIAFAGEKLYNEIFPEWVTIDLREGRARKR